MRQIPAPIQNTAHDLSVEGLVKLYEVLLPEGFVFCLSPENTVTWQGKTYVQVPCDMTDFKRDSQGKLNRPKFSFVNPEGVFTADIYAGELDNASITRIRILRSDLEANRDFAIREKLRVSRILSVSRHMVSVELRDVLDGHHFHLPARAYYPPEFPHVRL